ncbi:MULTISPECIES: NYN domain-containing protein [Pseudoalteromonas]|uniref:NYN domain-containing protein n=1 Tax=Pseudoalteromonas TaxID=53246 RepID=UPI0002DB9E9B|nr:MULTISPECIES: NYN domain-containing protein [Pseudoalteromonas]MCF6145608.1 hypothetical protein [Pseudoalteromonas mariniglutinosa NCIMB 1770]
MDIFRLFDSFILPSSTNEIHTSDNLSIKFFTADIIEKAAMSKDSLVDQQAYHRALTFHSLKNQLEIIKGYYSINPTRAFKIDEKEPKKPPNECEYVDIWKLEEKQTDVNIAVEALFDVLTDESIEQVVFVTNDTDLERALEKIKSLNKVKIGLVIPTTDNVRYPNEKLDIHADWTRKNILIDELKLSQLPRVIQGGRKPVTKPIGWFGQPEILEEIMLTLLKVEANRTKCWRWLEKPLPSFDDLPPLAEPPIQLLDNEETAKIVLSYAKRYTQLFKS